jgi:hypothetical protein
MGKTPEHSGVDLGIIRCECSGKATVPSGLDDAKLGDSLAASTINCEDYTSHLYG